MSKWLNPFINDWGGWAAATQARAWPNVNENRRGASYWFVNQGPLVAPMMGRYVTQFFYLVGRPDALYTELITADSGPGVYNASSGLNILGQQIDLEVRDWTAPHPLHGVLGVAFKFVYSRVGFADDVTNELFFAVPSPGDPECPFALDNQEGLASPSNPNTWTTTFLPGQDTDWNTPNTSQVCRFTAISSGREIPNN